jgi:hypothetical protein
MWLDLNFRGEEAELVGDDVGDFWGNNVYFSR